MLARAEDLRFRALGFGVSGLWFEIVFGNSGLRVGYPRPYPQTGTEPS